MFSLLIQRKKCSSKIPVKLVSTDVGWCDNHDLDPRWAETRPWVNFLSLSGKFSKAAVKPINLLNHKKFALLLGLSFDFAYLSLLRIQAGSCYIRPTLYLSVLTAFVFFGSDCSLVMGVTVELSRSFIVEEPHYVPALVMWTSWTILLSCIATRILL